jgi:hypothetical protein
MIYRDWPALALLEKETILLPPFSCLALISPGDPVGAMKPCGRLVQNLAAEAWTPAQTHHD